MNDIQRLEMLSESIKNEIGELQLLLEHSDNCLLKTKKVSFQKALKNIISNLESSNDSVYGVFEELNASDNTAELEHKCNIYESILKGTLSDDDKQYVRIKHNIDLW